MEELADNNKIIEKQKEIYLATIIHDLKNPLNAQISALEQLYRERFGGITNLQKEILKDIISSSLYMRELLASLLGIYKFENGLVRLKKDTFDVDNLIKICLRDVTSLADENCIFIQYVNSVTNTMITADENYIRRVIANMLNNMITYSYKNTKPVVLLENDEKNIIICFKSNGYPINDELKAHIFDKYTSGLNKKSGTGIGLYFCKKVIEAHNGSITLKTQNSNIEFHISIPIKNTCENFIQFN